MRQKIRKILSSMIYYSGIQAILYAIGTRKTTILTYHRIIDIGRSFELDPIVVNASIRNFERQMDYLKRNYNAISLGEFVDCCIKKKNPPKNSVIIRFDDGYKDNYTNAYPILKKYNLPAVIFLTTRPIEKKELLWWDKTAYIINRTKKSNLILKGFGRYSLKNKKKTLKKIQSRLKGLPEDKKNLMIEMLSEKLKVKIKNKDICLDWNQVREMRKNNISFGAHTSTHPILTHLPLKMAEREILESKRIIEKNIKEEVGFFSYPNGENSDFNKDIKKILKKAGFKCALTYIAGRNSIRSDLFELKNIFVQYSEDMIMFKNKLVGLDIIPAHIYYLLKRIKKNLKRTLCLQ